MVIVMVCKREAVHQQTFLDRFHNICRPLPSKVLFVLHIVYNLSRLYVHPVPTLCADYVYPPLPPPDSNAQTKHCSKVSADRTLRYRVVQDVQCAMFCVQYMSVFSPGSFRCSVYNTLFSVLCSAQLIVHCLLSGAPFALECLALCAVQLCRVHSVLAV